MLLNQGTEFSELALGSCQTIFQIVRALLFSLHCQFHCGQIALKIGR
jgi:hypothetical protein